MIFIDEIKHHTAVVHHPSRYSRQSSAGVEFDCLRLLGHRRDYR